MDSAASPEIPPVKALTGKAIALILLKEGLHGFVRACSLAAGAVGCIVKALLHHAWKLRYPLLRLPGAVASTVRVVLSSKLGRAMIAVAASLICITLHVNRHGGANVHVSSSLSLLFGLIKLEGSAVVQLGRRSQDDTAKGVENKGDEFRINCPQGLKEHIVRFLETQAARDPDAMPPWQLSPQKNATPAPHTDTHAHARLAASPAAAAPQPASAGFSFSTAPSPSAQSVVADAAEAAAPLSAALGAAAGMATPDGAPASPALQGGAAGAAAGGGNVMRLVEMLLPQQQEAAAGAGAGGQEGSGHDATGGSLSALAPGSPAVAVRGLDAASPGGALGTDSFGSVVVTPDATPDCDRSSASTKSTLSRTSLPSPGAASEVTSKPHALPGAGSSCLVSPHSLSPPTRQQQQQQSHSRYGAAQTAAASQRYTRAWEPWYSPGLLASLGPSLEDDSPLDRTGYMSLMDAAATYKASPGQRPTVSAARVSAALAAVEVRRHDSGGGDDAADDSDGELPYSAALSRYGSAASSCYGSAVSSAASTASAAVAGVVVSGGAGAASATAAAPALTGGAPRLRKSPDSILGLRELGLEGWHQAAREWERVHVDE